MDELTGGLSLVLPAFNEEDCIEQAITEADDALAQIVDEYEILLVDDGSNDSTREIAQSLLSTFPKLRILTHDENQGYGSALRTGFEAARFDRIAFTDADCQFDLKDLSRLLIRLEQAPIVVGYRIDRQDTRLRRFASQGYNLLAGRLLGIRVTDCDCALKVFRRDALMRILPESEGFFVNTEMLTRARQEGLAVAEVGVVHRPRVGGQSTVSWSQIPRILQVLLPFWWTQVLFPKQDADLRSESRTAWGLPLILFVAIALFFTQLDAPLLEPQEARHAEIPREMLHTGSAITPVLQGQPYLDKPPLLYWMTMASYRIFGVHDWAARVVPGLAGVMIVLGTFWWGRRMLGERVALASSLILCLSVRFIYLGRMVSFDVLLSLFVLLGLAFGHVAISRSRLHWRWWILSGLACGMGMMAKGPVAIVLTAGPIAIFTLLDRRMARPNPFGWLAWLLSAMVIAVPWHAWMVIHQPGFAQEYFWRHHVVRFLEPFDHQEPVWFFIPSVLFGMLPWTLLLPGMFRFLGRHSRNVVSRRPVALGFFLLCFLWGFVFFSLSGSKRAIYVLPVLPMLALSIGGYLDCILPRWKPGMQALLTPLPTLLTRQATLLVLWLTLLGAITGIVIGMVPVLPGMILITTPSVVLLWIWRQGERRFSWAACGLTTFVMLLVGIQWGLPAYNHRFALRKCIQDHRQVIRDENVTVASYPQNWSSISFYSGRNDVRTYSPDQKEALFREAIQKKRVLLFVKTGRSLDDLQRSLPSTLELRPEARQGRVLLGWLVPREEASFGRMVHRDVQGSDKVTKK